MNNTIVSVEVVKGSKDFEVQPLKAKEMDPSIDPELEGMASKDEHNNPLEGFNPRVK